jgi:hypothetical protein
MTSKAFSEEAPRPWLGKTVADWPVNAPIHMWGVAGNHFLLYGPLLHAIIGSVKAD